MRLLCLFKHTWAIHETRTDELRRRFGPWVISCKRCHLVHEPAPKPLYNR